LITERGLDDFYLSCYSTNVLITKTQDKLKALVGSASFDVCGNEGLVSETGSATRFIHRAALPGGGCINLLKVLMTNICVNDCGYCVNQVGRDCPRSSFKPEELAKTFSEMLHKRVVSGLFLSSGIAGSPSRTMESMIDTVQILRQHYAFRGYIHLKILPGTSFDCVEQACRIATRVSVNIEAPTAGHLAKLSAKKDIHHGILERMRWVKQLTQHDSRLAPSGQTTQFVVGAAGETDRDILVTTNSLYGDIGLRRVYFSAFQPVSQSRLEGLPATPPMREHRLYQTDWLLRVYGFSYDEVDLALGKSGTLDLNKDPKLSIARAQPWLFPVNVNQANYNELLRVPGIGPTTAQRILDVRQDGSISSMEQLKKMRVVVKRAAPYIRFNGMVDWEKQLSFIPLLEEAKTSQ
jgi:putative DNA modification/repair radical SAM protein